MDAKTNLIVLQPSSFCNINCRYCYVPDRKNFSLMEDSLLEDIIKKIFISKIVTDNFMMLWHSGEPLAVGIDFYKRVLDFIHKHNNQQKRYIAAVQTNATLINDTWASFFKENEFQVGVSLDGPEFLHDENRVGWNKKGTFKKVMKGVDFLKKHEIKLAAICVITKKTLDYPEEIFNFFIENNFSRLSFVIEEIIGENNTSTLNDVDNKLVEPEIRQKYANFMSTLFKLWISVKDKIFIREFNEICNLIDKVKTDPDFVSHPQEVTDLNIITIQRNGNISTYCPELAGGVPGNRDKFVLDNISSISSLDDLLINPNFLSISSQVHAGVDNCKQSCKYFNLCGRRSPGIKMYENKSFSSTETKHCILHRKTLIDVIIKELTMASRSKDMAPSG